MHLNHPLTKWGPSARAFPALFLKRSIAFIKVAIINDRVFQTFELARRVASEMKHQQAAISNIVFCVSNAVSFNRSRTDITACGRAVTYMDYH